MIKCTEEKKQLYFVQIKVKDPVTGNWKTKKKRGIQGKRNAQAEERRMLEDSTYTSTSATFRDMWNLWESATQPSEETKSHHRQHFEKRFSEYLDIPIEKITKAQLVEWRTALASDPHSSTATKNMAIMYVSGVFKFAHDVYDMKNPAAVLKRLKPTDAEIMREVQVWTPEEYALFRSGVKNELYALFFDTLYWTGMRRGEAIALQKADFKDGWLNVHASQETAKEGLKPTKTKTSRRVQIDEKLQKDLMPLMDEPGPYLFGGECPLAVTTIARYFSQAIEETGVRKIRLHDLRHSHATWLINNGANIVAVSKRLGHASIEQTLQTYTHLLQESDNDLVRKINDCRK